jgi:hypothetical protein
VSGTPLHRPSGQTRATDGMCSWAIVVRILIVLRLILGTWRRTCVSISHMCVSVCVCVCVCRDKQLWCCVDDIIMPRASCSVAHQCLSYVYFIRTISIFCFDLLFRSSVSIKSTC